MYLDSNGDGVHTTADAVNPAGPTTVDIWLDTAANRDGSPVVCDVNASQVVTFFSYAVGLRATGGTISWGTFTNRQTTFSFGFGQRKSATEFLDGYGGTNAQPPARYLLATLTLTVASGTPAIDIVPFVSVGSDFTSFGSHCLGIDNDNTLKLGSDWHDADGLPFGSTGSPNQPPLMEQPQDMTLATGELAFQTLTATDPDRQPLTFSKVSGPPFVTIATRDIGAGTAAGLAAVAPLASDAGISTTTVAVTDGLASAQKAFQVQVTAGPNHAPSLDPVGSLMVLTGTSPRVALNAVDSDGQPLVFEKLDGPDYMEVSTLTSGPGGAVGSLRLSPGPCDLGTVSASLQVTDGVISDSQELTITAKVARAAAPQPPFIAAGRSSMVGAADLNGDGHLDLLSSGTGEPLFTSLGHGDGTFAPATTQPLGSNGEPISVAFGDWNEDGRVDAAIAVFLSNQLAVFLGVPSGGLGTPVNYPTGGSPYTVRAADLDQDGHLDLAFAQNGGVGIMLGNGDGSFAPRTDYAAGDLPQGLALADFNRDGRLDFAVVGRDLKIRFGLGQGLFGDATTIPLTNAFDVIAADWNADGKADLAVSNSALGTVRIYMGDGNGGFTPGAQLPGFDGFQRMEAADIDLDGNEDLVAAVSTIIDDTYVAYGNGNGTFQANRKILEADHGLATGDFNEDGFTDVSSTKSLHISSVEERIRVWLNDEGGIGMPEARAFPESNSPAGGKPAMCMRLEPVSGSYQNVDIDPTSITLSPESGTGSVSAITTKSETIRDTDGNGITEIPACFPRDGIAALFDTQNGRQTVSARVRGALNDGRPFCAKVSFDIIGTSKKLAASVSPNPLNPGGILRLTTSHDGFVRVRLFDLHGRVVRTLEDRPMVPAGAHDVRIDGRNTSGQTLASGIYFYQVETLEGSLRGRITVLK